jgi:TPR repeat protein
MKLFRASADRGSAGCQFNVGVMFRDGRGAAANSAEAYFWFRLADRGGSEQADGKARQVRAQLRPDEIAVIERRLAVWKPVAADQP